MPYPPVLDFSIARKFSPQNCHSQLLIAKVFSLESSAIGYCNMPLLQIHRFLSSHVVCCFSCTNLLTLLGACARVTVVVLCVCICLSFCYHANCYILCFFVKIQVSLGFPCYFQRMQVTVDYQQSFLASDFFVCSKTADHACQTYAYGVPFCVKIKFYHGLLNNA